ncbi:MAG: hypothetical protein ACE5HC_00850 [Candidatus Binatia bacterium]
MRRHSGLTCRINLIELLRYVEDYVLIKKDSGFPEYAPGSDIDLVVFDREEAIRSIHSFYEREMGDAAEMKVSDRKAFCHVDFIFAGELDLRVDLIDNFDFFKNLAVKPSFMVKLFKDRQVATCCQSQVYVPSDEDELVLRYFEFLEWFDRRSDKIKHLDYICAVDDAALKQRFFANTHRFIQFKRKTWPPMGIQPQSREEARTMIKSGIRYLTAVTVKGLSSKIGRFFWS